MKAYVGPDVETFRRWLAFLRAGVGALYLFAFASKLGAGFIDNLPARLQFFAEHNRFDFSRNLLLRLGAHPRPFGWMVLVGELFAGVLLLLGLGTRIVATAALVLQLVYLFAAFGGDSLVSIANGLFIVALLVIIGTDGGYCCSLDRLIEDRK